MRVFTLLLTTSLTLASLGCDNMTKTTPGTPHGTTAPSSGTTTAPPPSTTTPPTTTPSTTPSTTPATPSDTTVPSPADSQSGVDKGAVDSTGTVREVEPKPSEK